MAEKFYKLTVAGCTRDLPIINISDNLAIAGFIMLGDTELVEKCAKALSEKLPTDIDILMTAEAKGIPLTHAIARLLGMDWYVVARKSKKAYMENPLWVETESITTKGTQHLCLMDADIDRIRGKRVLLIDDVISTGGSVASLTRLVEQAGGTVVGSAAVLAEGVAADRTDIIFLEKLPLFDPV